MSERLSLHQPITWVLLCMAACFLLLGVIFISMPTWGAAIFGIPAPSGSGEAYVRALGARDAAVALYIAALTLFSTRQSLSIVLGATVLIPLCDIVLIVIITEFSAPWTLALHAGSALCFVGMARWVRLGRSA